MGGPTLACFYECVLPWLLSLLHFFWSMIPAFYGTWRLPSRFLLNLKLVKSTDDYSPSFVLHFYSFRWKSSEFLQKPENTVFTCSTGFALFAMLCCCFNVLFVQCFENIPPFCFLFVSFVKGVWKVFSKCCEFIAWLMILEEYAKSNCEKIRRNSCYLRKTRNWVGSVIRNMNTGVLKCLFL